MTNFFKTFNMPYAKAICYSGFRNGQQPGGINPSYEEIKEDLLLLKSHWKYLRLYDCDEHALTVIKVIKDEKLQELYNKQLMFTDEMAGEYGVLEIAAIMMTQALSLYRSALDEEDYNSISVQVIFEVKSTLKVETVNVNIARIR